MSANETHRLRRPQWEKSDGPTRSEETRRTVRGSEVGRPAPLL